MYAAATSVALVGGEARPVRVEAHVGRQSEAFKLSGLPDTAVREAKDRVRAAVASAGIRFPNRTVTVNLAPADLPKGGTDYDLPIALGILAASKPSRHSDAVVVGELALDGAVRAGSHAFGAGVLSARQNVPCLVSPPPSSVRRHRSPAPPPMGSPAWRRRWAFSGEVWRPLSRHGPVPPVR